MNYSQLKQIWTSLWENYKKNMNKSILSYLILGLLIAGCTAPEDKTLAPDDIEGKKKFLLQKKKEYKELRSEIDKLSKELNRLDPPKEKAAVQVITQNLKGQEFKRYVDVQARVTAEDIVNVSSDVGGRLISVTAKEGDYVRKGQLVAVTDMESMDNQISELKTSLNLASTVYERQERLWKQDIGSELQYLEAKANKERLEKSLQTMQSQSSKKNLYAPISGIVDMKFLSQGETAGPGMPVLQILNTGSLKIVADLQESLLGSVKKGNMVEVSIPSMDLNFKKPIAMIGRTIDPANRTFKIEVNTSSLKGKLKPNLLANVRLNDLTQSDVVMIPIDAIQEDVGGNKFVFVTKRDGDKLRAEKRLIEIGESNGESVVVLIGLDVGDTLVTQGGLTLSDNDLITI